MPLKSAKPLHVHLISYHGARTFSPPAKRRAREKLKNLPTDRGIQSLR